MAASALVAPRAKASTRTDGSRNQSSLDFYGGRVAEEREFGIRQRAGDVEGCGAEGGADTAEQHALRADAADHKTGDECRGGRHDAAGGDVDEPASSR